MITNLGETMLPKHETTKKTYPEDPERCQGTIPSIGQCQNKAMPNCDYCIQHGGDKQLQAIENKKKRNYALTKWKASLDGKLSDTADIKSLREEIGILRILMEERLNLCKDTHDLLLSSGPLSDLDTKIEKLVVSCHKLESSMGQHLDKSSILIFASKIIDIIGDTFGSDPRIEEVAAKIIGTINHDS